MMRALHAVSLLCLCLCAASSPAAEPPAGGITTVGGFSYDWAGLFSGARLSAMGGADIAGEGGSSALLVNAAPTPLTGSVSAEYHHLDFLAGGRIGILGLGGGWRDWRIGVCVAERSQDGVAYRTAYDPEILGTVDVADRLLLIGVSREIGGLLWPGSDVDWTVGIVHRRFRSEAAFTSATPAYESSESSATAGTWDLGTTWAWRGPHAGGWHGVRMTLSLENFSETKLASGALSHPLPSNLRLGAAAESAFGAQPGRRDPVLITLAYLRTIAMDDFRRDTNHAGIEALLFEILALRWGHSQNAPGNGDSWGVGLVADHPFGGPASLRADWGALNLDDDEDLEMWSVRGSVDF